MQNMTSYSCSATPISYKNDEISRISRIVFDIPLWGILEFGATLTSYSCSTTQISYKCDEISRLSRLVTEILLWCIWGFGGVFGYIRCKIRRHILALRPQFLIGVTKFCTYLA